MQAAWARRLRWRRRGAWQWPTFIAATGADAFIGHLLPLSGQSEAFVAGALAGLVLNVIAIVLLSRPVAMALRRVRPALPMVVARDYAGTVAVLVVAAGLLAGGLAHHARVVSDERAMQDALVRAQAFIGDRAPAEFRGNVRWVSMFALQPGSLYRACVAGVQDGRTYCVIVDTRKPLADSVSFGGYEPNRFFSEGVG